MIKILSAIGLCFITFLPGFWIIEYNWHDPLGHLILFWGGMLYYYGLNKLK